MSMTIPLPLTAAVAANLVVLSAQAILPSAPTWEMATRAKAARAVSPKESP